MTTEQPATVEPLVADPASGRDTWLAHIDAIGDEAGYFQPLGSQHWAFFSDEGTTLLVTFETVEAIRAAPSQLPAGHAIAAAKGWSHLCIIADGPTWYRDPALYRYFDRLVDDAFFEDFDHVVFYGAGMGGYGACAYSVTAPGATVLAVQPRATLDPAVAVWDTRHLALRRLNFTDRYGYAPDMIEGTGQVFVIFDQTLPIDAMHAALFTKPYVTMLRCRHMGRQADLALAQMEVLQGLIEAACEGRLTPAFYATALRQRRNYSPYLRALVSQAETSGHPARAATICRHVVPRLDVPFFRKRLARLQPASARTEAPGQP